VYSPTKDEHHPIAKQVKGQWQRQKQKIQKTDGPELYFNFGQLLLQNEDASLKMGYLG
jgi:hypothetical protein